MTTNRYLKTLLRITALAATLSPAEAAIFLFNTSDSTGETSGTGEFRDIDTGEVLTTVTITSSGETFKNYGDGNNFINISEGTVSTYTFDFADRVSGLIFSMSNFTQNHRSFLTLDSTTLTNPNLIFAENGFGVDSSGTITGGGSGSVQSNGRFNLGEADRLVLEVTGLPSASGIQGIVQMRINGLAPVPEPASAGSIAGLLALGYCLVRRKRPV